MTYAVRTLIALTILISVPWGVEGSRSVALPASPASVVEPEKSVMETAAPGPSPSMGTERQQELLEWALNRYQSAGLRLPELEFRLHSDREPCGGNQGFLTRDTTPWLIALCTDERFVFLHELGHAWAAFSLTETDKSVYTQRQGLESWNNAHTAWADRGSEDAANTLAWGLLDEPITFLTADGPLAQRNEAFLLLTGIDSPRVGG